MVRTTGHNRIRVWHVVLVLVGLLCATIIGVIAHNHSAPMPAPPSLNSSPKATATPVAPVAAAPKSTKPKSGALAWEDLTPAQRQALEPLAADWHELGPIRKKKWLALANKFPSLNSDSQRRVQERMTEWTKLTPQQRRVARDSYSRAEKLNSEQKSARWEQYQQLPDDQKEKLANSVAPKQVATLPPVEGKGKNKNIPSIDSTSRPALEKSLIPQPGPHAVAAAARTPPESIPPAPPSSAVPAAPTLPASASLSAPETSAPALTAQAPPPSAAPTDTTTTEPAR